LQKKNRTREKGGTIGMVLSPKTKPELEDIFLMPEMPATLRFITAYVDIGL
jgi:hypothetical protein